MRNSILHRVFNHIAARPAAQIARPAGAMFEPLEGRRMMAATPMVYNATDVSETVRLSAGSDVISIVRNGAIVSQRFASDVSSIQINLHGGHDVFSMSEGLATKRVSVYGGAGNDWLYGAGGTQRFHGEAGNDRIAPGADADYVYGGADHDSIFGGTGGDIIYGGEGHDTINGGEGQDWIYGERGNDVLTGGADTDVLSGGDDDDQIFASGDGARDHVYGGAGRDAARIDHRPWYAPWQDQDSCTTVEIVQRV